MENKADISKQLPSGLLSLKSWIAGKSEVWSNYMRVYKDKSSLNWVSCIRFQSIFQPKPHKFGTSALISHAKKCRSPGTSGITNVFTHKSEPTLQTSEKKAVTDSVAHLCSIDLRPINNVARAGLEEFTAVLCNLGYKHGQIGKPRVPVQIILPHRTTVSLTLQQNASLAREEFILLMKSTGVSRYGVVLDFWKNDKTGDNYLGVSLHFVTNYSLCWSNLATRLYYEKKLDLQLWSM